MFWKKRPGASFIKLCVDFILKVCVRTYGRICVRTKVFRFIKPCVGQNLRKNPFRNPSQGKIVRTCISTPTPPRNHHIWSLQRLVLLCITSSACHFHAYSHARDTMFNTETLRKYEMGTIMPFVPYTLIFIAKNYPVSLLCLIIYMKISINTRWFKVVFRYILE